MSIADDEQMAVIASSMQLIITSVLVANAFKKEASDSLFEITREALFSNDAFSNEKVNSIVNAFKDRVTGMQDQMGKE